MPEKYLNSKEAAVYLNVSIGTVRNMVCQNRLPHYKVNGKLLFKAVEIDNWMQQYRVASDAEIAALAVEAGE